jgi:hypothetical protein
MAQNRKTRQKQIQTPVPVLTYDLVRFLKLPLDDLLEVLDRGQLILNGRRQLAGYPIGGHSDRLIDVLESKLHQGAATALAQQNPDARPLDRSSHRAVHGS